MYLYVSLHRFALQCKLTQHCINKSTILLFKKKTTVSMPAGHHRASSHRKEGQFILFASRKLLHHPAPASPEAPAPACSPRAGTRLPRALLQTLRQPQPALQPPRAECASALSASAAHPRQGCQKLQRPHSQQGRPAV